MARFYQTCLHPGCTKRGDFCRGMCSPHYLVLRKECRANGSWPDRTPLSRPIVIEKFEWLGDEETLAAMCEEQERLKALENQQEQDLKADSTGE